jgi:hypothetical protein
MHVRQERGELIQIKGATSKDRRDFRNKSATEGVILGGRDTCPTWTTSGIFGW